MAKKTTSKSSASKDATSDKDSTANAPEDAVTGAGAAESPETSEAGATGAEAPDDADISAQDESTSPPEDPPDDTALDGDGEPASAETADTLDEAELAGGDNAAADTSTDMVAPQLPAPAPDPVVVRQGGFGPMFLGGLAAGLIGLGAGYTGHVQGWWPSGDDGGALRAEIEGQLKAQSDQIAGLTDQVAATPAPDLSQIEQDQSDLLSSVNALADRLADTEGRIADLDARVATLETRPLTEGVSDAAVAAYEAELKKLQDAMAAQRAEIEAMTDEARQMETSAQETAQATMRRAALSRVQTALDAGGGFADALADLQAAGVSVPDVLSRTASDGVPTLADLQAGFPDAARAALAVARAEAAKDGDTGGLTAFLRTQLGARSLEPREGNDPDAILSRAEAATRDGRLTDALAETESLPEAARAELSDWAGQAARRLDAVAAAQKLSEELN